MADGRFLYEQIADNIRTAISAGSLQAGERLKSVRMLSKELGVSISTVFKAYFDLEGDGLIESRPKSGYYVKTDPGHIIALSPAPQPNRQEITTITNRDVIREVMNRPGQRDDVELAMVTPSPSLLPIAKIKKSIQRIYLNDEYAAIRYEGNAGNPELRRIICQHALSWGKAYNEEDVIITAGCLEALTIGLRTLTEPGDTVAVESPTFYGFLQILSSLKLNVVEIPCHEKTGISVPDLAKALERFDIKAILLIPNFNNPLGSCIPDENKREIVRMASQKEIPIIENDVFGELYYSESRPKNLKTYDDEGWVIYCSSFSKTLAPGFRVGWCLPGRFKEQILVEKFFTNAACSSISQAVILNYLKHGRYDLHLKKLRKALRTQNMQYAAAIREHFPSDVKFSSPASGFVIWIEMDKSKNAMELYQLALKQKILITPGQIFSAKADYHNYIRISYGSPYCDVVDQAIRTLGELIRQS